MTKKQSDTSIEVLGGFRLAFYLLLSRAFSREPNKAVLKNMEQISGTLMDVWETLGLPSDPDIEAGRELLKTFFSRLKDDDADTMAQGLAREYASLFLGVGAVTVSPCESVYRSTSGLLYQSALFEVQQSYREIGMAKSDLYQEPDDHIAVELSYMARLCELTQEAVDAEREQALALSRAPAGFSRCPPFAVGSPFFTASHRSSAARFLPGHGPSVERLYGNRQQADRGDDPGADGRTTNLKLSGGGKRANIYSSSKY